MGSVFLSKEVWMMEENTSLGPDPHCKHPLAGFLSGVFYQKHDSESEYYYW